MKKKNFTPKHKAVYSFIALLLVFFISMPQELDAQVQCPLAANDLVQVSLDQNCQALITTGMILEGEDESGNCDYLIKGIWEEDGTEVPYTGVPGNYVLDGSYLGQILTAWVGFADPLDLRAVEGQFYLEDKLPPVLNCLEDVVVSCNEDLSDYLTTSTDASYTWDATQEIIPSVGPNFLSLPANIPDGGYLDVPFTVDNLANQSEFLDQLQVLVDASTYNNLTVEISGPFGTSPSGPLSSPFVDVWFAGMQMLDPFFDGAWTLRVTDQVNDGTVITLNDLELNIQSTAYMLSQYGLSDNCQVDEVFVISDETEDLKDCGDWSAVRTIVFRGVDHVGMLSNICTHTVYYERKTVNDIVWPLNRDDYQLDALNCSNIPEWDLNGDGYPQPEESGLPTIDGVEVSPDEGYSGYCEIGLTYTDQRIDICPGTFKILRLWTAVNCCGPTGQDNPTSHYQIVKVVDDEGPIVSACFPDIVVSADPFTCDTDVKLPGPFEDPYCPMVIYDCAMESITYEIGYKFGDCDNPPGDDVPWIYDEGLVQNPDGTWTLLNVPAGCTWIKYTFTDGCGNSTDAFFEILVEDNIPPIPVCDEHTVVTVTGECSARAYAETFDDGSFDNCSPVHFEVRRMTGTCGGTNNFGPYVDFCSYDVGNTVMIELKVIDDAGNWNTCMVEARVDDKTPPYVVCPDDIKISCDENYLDLDVTGHPEAFDNCGIQSLEWVDNGDLDQCNTGTIFRTFTVTDFGGRTHDCTQRIDIIDYDPFDFNDITWPADVLNLEGCINADTDPGATGEPILNDDFCSLVAFTYEDQVFTLVEDACYKILRNWTVLDWCQFDQFDPFSPGIWSYTQVIMVYNYDAPEFTSSCDDINICGYNSDCTGDVSITATAEDECTPVDQLVWEYRVDFFDDGTIDRFGFTNTYAENHVELGTHRIYWTVEELCGNYSTCDYTFTVEDCKKPTPLCISEITTVLMPSSGMVEVNARDFDHGSYDNCTKGASCGDCASDLIYSFSEDVTETTRIFTIADVGLNDVEMWVTDEYGNQDYCEVSIMIQDNANLSGMVAGMVMTEEDAKVEEVQMELEEINVHESVFETTNHDGYYQMQGNHENGDYMVRGSKQDSYTKGVSTLDLVIIQKHLLGILSLDSPYKLLAADADNNDAVSANDLFQLRQLILGVQSDLPNSEAWNFVNDDYLFPNPENPWYQADEEEMYSILLRNLDTDEMHNDFVAIKIGDVNGSVSSLISQNELENRSVVSFFTANQSFTTDELIAIPVYAGDFANIAGWQLGLNYNDAAMTFEGLVSGALDVNENNFAELEGGNINFSWNRENGITAAPDQVLFTINMRAKTDGQLKDQLTLNSDMLDAEVYSDDLEIKNAGFEVRTQESNGFVLYQNTPNPFENETEIVFELPAASFATLTVYDLTGKVLMTVSQEFAKGMNSVSMSKNDLKTTGGVLYYQLETGDNTAVKKMIMIK